MRPCPRIQPALIAVLLAIALALGLASCSRKEAPRPGAGSGSFDSLPPAELTERGARDSARVAQLVIAYFERLAAKHPDKALELFFPESLRIAAPAGGVETEGRSVEAAARIAAEESTTARVRRIVLLRRAAKELLENNYRETWGLRYVPDRADSATIERRVYVIQQLGSDTRWLGRIEAGR